MASKTPFDVPLADTFHRSFPGRTARDKARPIRWQAGDEMPRGSILRQRRGGYWTKNSTSLLVASVFASMIGGAGTVTTLVTLGAPEAAPGVAAARPIYTAASDDERSAAIIPAVGKMPTALPPSAGGLE